MEAPWHSNSNTNEGFPSFPGAPIKRTPIKGKILKIKVIFSCFK